MRSVTRLTALGAIAVALLVVRTAGGFLLGGPRATAPPDASASSLAPTVASSSGSRIAACEIARIGLAGVLDSAGAAEKAGTAAAAEARTDEAKAMAMWDTTAKFLVLQGRRAAITVPEPLQPADTLLVRMLNTLFRAYGEFGVSYINTDHGARVRGLAVLRAAKRLGAKASTILSTGSCDAV